MPIAPDLTAEPLCCASAIDARRSVPIAVAMSECVPRWVVRTTVKNAGNAFRRDYLHLQPGMCLLRRAGDTLKPITAPGLHHNGRGVSDDIAFCCRRAPSPSSTCGRAQGA